MSDDSAQPTFKTPDDAEQRWISNAVESMRVYLRDSGRLDRGEITPAILDEAWVDLHADWKSSDAGDQPIKDAINQVGLAFGQILVDRFGMEWTVATDSHGTDFAVRGDSGWVVYPRDVVTKRYANDESGFLAALFRAIEERS